ncbi:MAG: hypothetical protein K0S32_2777 [Bacteroidetes bacterium]|jgi:hypothetical protein|nr:hypothetical protein [Bacteroidota bacterium]
MFKKIIIRIFALVIIIAGLNLIYNFTFYKKDLEEKCEQVVELRKKQPDTDIFYFAESSNFNVREDDSIKQSISEITNFFYPSLKITAINKPATHGGIYRHWLTHIDLTENKPKAVIITLNLRSFDANWIHSKLETPLQESVVLLKPYPKLLNRFLLSLNAFDNKTEQQRERDMIKEWETTQLEFPFPFKYKTVTEWDYHMAQGTYTKPDGSWDAEKITLACHYVKTYAFNIKENNPRVKDFDFMADWCHKNNVNLYFNLLAENLQYADSLVGKELVFLMKQNRDFLVNRYNKNNCKVIDNLEAVPGKEYTDQNWTTEHYSYKGRMAIAKNLANGLRTQFNNYYKAAY